MALQLAAVRTGIPIELVLAAGTHEVPEGINIGAAMGASELTLRAAMGATVTLSSNISVSAGVLVLDGLILRGAANLPAPSPVRERVAAVDGPVGPEAADTKDVK